MLLLHRQLPAEAVVAGMTTVVEIGSVNPDLVAIEARKAIEDSDLDEADGLDGTEGDACDDQDDDTEAGGTADEGAKVISLHTRRLPPDPRTQLPDMAKYDRLLAPPAPPRKQQKGTSA